jgi:CheY-like chemotaxis protein/HPt (histidine-containing phosphotransfer) domain-containing protein
MNEPPPSFDPNELSEDDLAVLRAFDALENLEDAESAPVIDLPGTAGTPDTMNTAAQEEHLPPGQAAGTSGSSLSSFDLLKDMFTLFATEADEDIATMWQALHQQEQDDSITSSSLVTLKQRAHKLKGTAGAVGCASLSRIARYIEGIVKLVQSSAIPSMTGLVAFVHAVRSLEVTLYGTIIEGRESQAPLEALEADLQALNIDIQAADTPTASTSQASPLAPPMAPTREGAINLAPTFHQAPLPTLEPPPESQETTLDHLGEDEVGEFQHVGARFIAPSLVGVVGVRGEGEVEVGTDVIGSGQGEALRHVEQLVEQRTSVESAQAEVEVALQELHTAQARLQHLETLLFTIPLSLSISNSRSSMKIAEEVRPTSSLVARILDEATQRTGQVRRRKKRYGHTYSQDNGEQEGSDIPILRQLRTVPFWDELEMDRYSEGDLLVRSLSEAIADVATASSQLRLAFAELQHTLQKYASLTTSVHSDVLSFLGLPRTHGMIQGLLVRAGSQVVVVPYSQVLRIGREILRFAQDDRRSAEPRQLANDAGSATRASEPRQLANDASASTASQSGKLLGVRSAQGPYDSAGEDTLSAAKDVSATLVLCELLGFPDGSHEGDPKSTLPGRQVSLPCVIVQQGNHELLAVQVNEIVGEVELVMRPLAAYLQRPGLMGTAIDGKGNVLLVLDLPELVKQKNILRRISTSKTFQGERKQPQPGEQLVRTILIADDSVYMRQSLLQTLSRAGYHVKEARDGTEALEQVLEEPPDLLLLDIEMPKLNGYELLSIIRTLAGREGFERRSASSAHGPYTDLKIVMLTSRSLEKYRQRALELGAHAYLTKPCPQDVLLKTLQELLTS